MSPVLTLLLAAGVTWLLRVSFITMLPAGRLPASIQGALDDVAPAVMAAIVVTHLVHGEGIAGLVSIHPIAALATAGVAWRTQSLALTTVAGVVVFGLLRLLV